MSGKILIVDDEDLVIRSLERLLKKAGYETMSVTRADDAIAKVKDGDFDLIVSDIRMPGMDGVQMVKEIRRVLEESKRKKIPEIFMTGYANADTAKEAEGLQVAEYVYKPFDIKQFLELVGRHIKKG